MKKAATLCLILWAAASCSRIIDEKAETGSITGIVADKTTGEPVGTASLTLSPGGKKTVTGSDGGFQFIDIEPGPYSISLQKDGYKLESHSTLVTKGKNTEAHLLIERIPAIVTADRDILDFGENESVTQLSFGIVNSGYIDLTWHTVYDCIWIKETSPKINTEQVLKHGKTATVIVTIDRTKLPYGKNETNIIIYSDNGRSQVRITAMNTNTLPISNTKEATDISTSAATLNAEILSEGSPKYTRRGFAYSTNQNPTTSNSIATAEVNSSSNYSATVSGLQPGMTYYVRAFAENSKGIAYSTNEVSFTTIENVTAVTTLNVSNIDVISGKATFNGSITTGSPAYTERGFCYNTSGEPDTSENKVAVSGNDAGEYSYTCAGLRENTVYYVRAYAVQCGRTHYGTTVTFSTNKSATSVYTSAATGITSTSAILNGSITQIGNPAFTEKGFCYGTGHTPTINDTKVTVSGNGSGSYSANIYNLQYDKNYYYRSYAIQNGEAIYGNIINFCTPYTKAGVETAEASDIGYNSLTLNGNVTDTGDPFITERGFCYSGSYNLPTISHNRIKASGIAYGTFKTEIKGLSEGITYYIRAYVIQDGNVYYGQTKTAKTYEPPIVATGQATDIQVTSLPIYWQATLQGGYYEGAPYAAEVGFVYSTYDNPVVGAAFCTQVRTTNVTVKNDNAKYFTLTVSDLPANKVLYYRAYVKTSMGYTYGETLKLITM